MVNYNPETVSTDYDECDRLYFDEISYEVSGFVPFLFFNSLSNNAPWCTLLYHFTLSKVRRFYSSMEDFAAEKHPKCLLEHRGKMVSLTKMILRHHAIVSSIELMT